MEQLALDVADAALVRYRTEFRAETTTTGIKGHAAVFDQLAALPGGEFEQIGPDAFTRALQVSDVRSTWNHDPSKLLGRQGAGTLRVDVDDKGLAFDVDLPDTSYANDLRVLVDRGDVNGGSFAFVPDKSELRMEAGNRIRTHTDVRRLVEVGPVTFPAYEGAGVALRAFDLALAEPLAATVVISRIRQQTALARHRARTRE